MKKVSLNLKNAEQVVEFVKVMNGLPYDADVCYGSCIVDAKSLLGVMSLAAAKTVELVMHADDCGEIQDKLVAYAV